MAWNKLPKGFNKQAKPQALDPIDREAEAEGEAIRQAPRLIGPSGKRIAKQRRNHDRGDAIVNNRVIGKYVA